MENCYTLLDHLERQIRTRGDEPFLGTRVKVNEKEFGAFEWKSYRQVEVLAKKVARGIKKLGLSVETEGDGRKWNFVGIWSRNREEWLTTHIANMYYSMTTIGFFDSMGISAVDFILTQTELSCIFTTPEYISKIVTMKKEGLAKSIKYLVSFDEPTPE